MYDCDVVCILLSVEGVLNDVMVYFVVMLVLGLLGLYELGDGFFVGVCWLFVDMFWFMGVGVLLGMVCGCGLGWVM